MKRLEKKDDKWFEVNEHAEVQSELGMVVTLMWIPLLIGLVASVG